MIAWAVIVAGFAMLIASGLLASGALFVAGLGVSTAGAVIFEARGKEG